VEKDAAKKYTRSVMEIDILFGILCEGVLNIAMHYTCIYMSNFKNFRIIEID